MTTVVDDIPAGSGGVIFTPWLHGNRCPFEDPNARGMFFNISLDTGKPNLSARCWKAYAITNAGCWKQAKGKSKRQTSFVL